MRESKSSPTKATPLKNQDKVPESPQKVPKTPENPTSPKTEKVAKIPEKPLQIADRGDLSAEQSSAKKRKNTPFLISFICLLLGAVLGVCLYFFLYLPAHPPVTLTLKKPTPVATTTKHYSVLTGLEISDPDLNHSPTYCVQIPNGLDGARPQVGLLDAEIVFEAQAEREVTRFAAIFQNPTSVIGPLRSLRLYYLEWDTPFDCTIVHAGGSADALAAVSYGGYRDLTENYTYMYRGEAYNRVMNRYWNNLFTNANYFKNWSTDTGFTFSNPVGFARLTPEASEKSRVTSQAKNPLDIDTPTIPSVKELAPAVSKISLSYARSSYYDPVFTYNSEKNTYDRSYASGHLHTVYDCDASLGNITPELACSDAQLSPSVVIAIVVDEHVAAYDNYHEEITTLGSGRAVVFQNGTATEGTWEKPTKNDQLVFKDSSGSTISLAPGQTWISAVPAYGSINYE